MDIVDVARVTGMLARAGERVTTRLLTPAEWAYCARMQSPAAHVAARLAAKEAAFKALSGTEDARGIGWRDVEIVHSDHGRPIVVLQGRAAARARELGVARVLVTLTHSRLSAAAVVILETEG
jgi:holo-[acyl-carrier protein] synthase